MRTCGHDRHVSATIAQRNEPIVRRIHGQKAEHLFMRYRRMGF
ncbi:MAG: hypothetical protein P0120_08180 [Nitrospira sp.]|nr:hypothetical protein [Nitrospira sp.]